MNHHLRHHLETLSDEKLDEYANHYADSYNFTMVTLCQVIMSERRVAARRACERQAA